MLWFNLGFSDFIKKRVCKFFIQRYFGQFFEEKLTVDQICLDLYNGKGSVSNVKLCCEAINSLFEAQGLDFEITNGQIGSLAVHVPWNCLMSEDSVVEVNDLYLCLRPQARAKNDDVTMLESMWSSMSSSMQLAQECLEKNDDAGIEVPSSSNNMEGLEKFAQTIDNILIRVKVKLVNTTIRIEYLPTDSTAGVAVIIKIKSLGYQNEARNDAPDKEESEKTDQKTIVFSTHSSHYITLDDITFYSEEFRIGDRKEETRSRHTSTKSVDEESSSLDPFASTISSFSPDNEMFYNQSALADDEQKNKDADESDDECDEINRTEMVLMGCLKNRQEIRINMKLAEQIEGPKVSLEVTFSAIVLFFTPRQFHMLLLLCDILLNGDVSLADEEAKILKEKLQMQAREDEKRKISSFGSNLLAHQTWTGDDYESDMASAKCFNTLRPDSILSSNSSMTSSMQSSASQCTSHSYRHKRAIDRDQNADISHFNIRIAGIYALLLHDDVLVPGTNCSELPVNESTVEKLRYKSEYFFNYTNNLISSCSTTCSSDLKKIGTILNNACDNNHLRFIFAPIIVSGEERRTEKGNRTRFNISISRADVREILDGLSLPILDFNRKDSTTEISRLPEVSIAIEKTFYILKSLSGRQYMAPRFNMEISLGTETETHFAFDISIFDRIHALFSSPFSLYSKTSDVDPNFAANLSPSSQRIVQSKSEIKITSDILKLILFFPIVDLRPLHDPDKIPYWKRNVRPDFLQIKFIEFKLNLISSIYDIFASEIKFYYNESEKHSPIYFGKASFYENLSTKYYPAAKEFPRIVIQLPSDAQLQEMNEEFIRNHQDKKEDSDSDPASYESIKIKPNLEKDSTPFSTKRVCRESDTPHNKTEYDESETLLIPGDREEMKQFCDNAMKFSKIQVKIEFPVVSVQLKSKHFYEVFYNRIVSDILMWESSVPKAKPPEVALTLKKPPDSLMNASMMDSIYAPYTMCKSNINFESSSSATNSESESDNDPVFYSIYEKSRKRSVLPIYQTDYSSGVALELNIGQGIVTMYAPVRDAQNHVIPQQLGEFVIKANATSIFTVSNYHGNTNLGYFCIQSGNVEMYHCGLLPVPIQNPPLREVNCSLPAWLNATIYGTPKNLNLSESHGSVKRDMLSLAVQIKANPDQGIKRIKVSLGIQNGTLRYFSTLSEHLWLTQLMDMFDVKEDIVPGYTPYTNLTELHLHLWDISIDYRPLLYAYRAIATIGNLMISSNIATGSVGCTLRFVAEDVTLSLAQQCLKEKQTENNKITALPASELICVAELGLFEISLKLNEKVTPLSPKFDLRTAIKDVHVRTCSDSGRALLEFISYLASEGDLVNESKADDNESETSSIMQTNDDELLPMKNNEDIPEVTESQQKHVNTLMADAMEESIYIPSTSNTQNDSGDSDEPIDLGTEVFFFPDEQSKKYGNASTSGIRKSDSYKRRCASEDSISIDSSSYREDEEIFVRRFEQKEEDSGSVNTEMRELLDFETSVMVGLKDTEDYEPLPQVEMDLGDISKYDHPSKSCEEPAKKASFSESDDDFCFVVDEERPTYSHDLPVADDPIRIIDNHFSAPHGKPDLLKAPANFPMAVQRYTLCEMTLVWHLYGGRDFEEHDKKKEREQKEETRKAFTNYPMSEVYKMGVSYTKGSHNLTLGGSQNKLNWKTRGGFGRKHDVLMEIHLNKVRFSHETYPTTTEQASRQVLLVTELEIRDRLAISNINKFLYHPTVGFRTRQGNNHMVVVKALHLRPEPALKTQECCLRISLLPIRLNIDQDSLLFMINFFNELSGGNDLSDPKASNNTQAVAKVHQPPVMIVELPDAAQELQARKMVSDNLTLLLNEENKSTREPASTSDEQPPAEDSSPIFFRHVIFSPDVTIRLDYQGKRVELSHGPLAGLLMGLGQLQCSEIRLKKISYRHGILGVDRLINFLIQEWLQDIKKRQLPKILGGVGPMYSLVQLFQGIFDLFYLPFEQYQKDGRIVRGIQRGAQSFTARTALAALEITSRIIYLLQITAETAYDMVSPGPSVRRRVNRKGKRKRIHPPQDIREGMSNAYYIVKDGIGDTAQTIMQMTALEHDQKGYTGAAGALLRQIPPTVVRPLVLATQASHQVLGGVKNQLIPDARIEAKEKWKDGDEN